MEIIRSKASSVISEEELKGILEANNSKTSKISIENRLLNSSTLHSSSDDSDNTGNKGGVNVNSNEVGIDLDLLDLDGSGWTETAELEPSSTPSLIRKVPFDPLLDNELGDEDAYAV